jgi:hypothetical protein
MTLPSLTKAAYNAATGALTLNGTNLTSSGYTVTDFTLKGDGGTSYTLTGGSLVSGTPTGNSVVIKLSSADQLAVDGLLNKNGTQANDGTTSYNLSATTGWDTGAGAITTKGITVSGVTAPTISAVAYDAGTGVFTITGNNLDNHGSANGITLSDFTLKGGSSGSYSFGSNDTVSNLTAKGFTVTLSSADETLVNAFVNKNGTAPLSGAAYKLTATANWDSDNGAAIATKAVTVSNVGTQPTTPTLTQSWFADVSSPGDLAVDNSGNLYVADGNGIDKISANGTTTTNIINGVLSYNEPIAVDNAANIYFTSTGGYYPKGIDEISAGSNTVSSLLASNAASNASSLAADGSGNVYFANSTTSTITEIATGTHAATTIYSGATFVPYNITLDNAGNVYALTAASSASITAAMSAAAGNLAAIAKIPLYSIVEISASTHAETTVVTFTDGSLTGTGAVNTPNINHNSFVIDKSGNIFYGTTLGISELAAGSHNITALSITGMPIGTSGLAISNTGTLYASDLISNDIQQFTGIAIVGVNSHEAALHV